MNIVYGGSFNPPTKAHEAIVNCLKEQFNPENIIVIPTPSNYTWKKLPPYKMRKKMCEIAFKEAIVLDIEEKNDKYLGTLETLDKLSEKYKNLYFCMGADNLLTIKKWINYETLLEKYRFIIFARNGINIDEFIQKELSIYKTHFQIVNFNIDISSTQFRNTKDESLVSKDVLDYLKKNKLEVYYE